MTQDGMHGPAKERADAELDAMLAELRRSYNPPPATVPLDEMWGAIERGRRGGWQSRTIREGASRARAAWWIGMAAALVVGVGIGRMTTGGRVAVATSDGPTPAAIGPDGTRQHPAATSYDLTTARYLGQTAALLIALPAEARAGRADARFVARAAELLTTTRLLLDSPAAADPKVRALLEDLELVLAQVAHLEADGRRVELELITQALEERDLLPRLHSAVAGSADADN